MSIAEDFEEQYGDCDIILIDVVKSCGRVFIRSVIFIEGKEIIDYNEILMYINLDFVPDVPKGSTFMISLQIDAIYPNKMYSKLLFKSIVDGNKMVKTTPSEALINQIKIFLDG